MASIMGLSTSTAQPSSKRQYKIDDMPADVLETDMMNESFYDKQHAIMEEIERAKRRR